jgi:hypothetical protein
MNNKTFEPYTLCVLVEVAENAAACLDNNNRDDFCDKLPPDVGVNLGAWYRGETNDEGINERRRALIELAQLIYFGIEAVWDNHAGCESPYEYALDIFGAWDFDIVPSILRAAAAHEAKPDPKHYGLHFELDIDAAKLRIVEIMNAVHAEMVRCKVQFEEPDGITDCDHTPNNPHCDCDSCSDRRG